MSVSGEKSKEVSEGCMASSSSVSKQARTGLHAVDNTGPKEPSVTKPATVKANITKGKKCTVGEGKEKNKAKLNVPMQEEAVQKQLDNLESTVERLISNMMHDKDESDTGGSHMTVPGLGLRTMRKVKFSTLCMKMLYNPC